MKVENEQAPPYGAKVYPNVAAEDAVIREALDILASRIRKGPALGSPQEVKDYLKLKLGGMDREAFGVLFLDQQHQVIEFEILFQGGVSQVAVYPREVVKRALQHNASALILAHNHPSGVLEASRADEHLTQLVKQAAGLLDIRVLDHFIVSNQGAMSFAEKGLI